MNETRIANVIIDTDTDGGCALVRGVVTRQNRRTLMHRDGITYLPGSFQVLTDEQAAEIEAAEERVM